MISSVTVTTTYNCTLDRAFKTPFLCDLAKIHTGFLFMPRVTKCEDDKNWGQPGNSKKVFTADSFFTSGGYAFDDKVIERSENKSWKIEVSNFQSFMFGFSNFSGTWKTTEIRKNEIEVQYSYDIHSDHWIFYPVNWIFTKTIWKRYMKNVIENIRKMIYNDEPYLFS